MKEIGADWIRQLLNRTSSGDKAPKLETDQPNEQRKKKQNTRADSQLALAFLVPTGCIHLTSSTSEGTRPRAQHLVISEICSQPRQCWSNQTHLCTNGSLCTAHSQWATAPSVHVHTVTAWENLQQLPFSHYEEWGIYESFNPWKYASPEITTVWFFANCKRASWLCPCQEALDLHVGAAVTPSACLHWFFNAAWQFKYLTLIGCDKLNLLNVGVSPDWPHFLTSLLLHPLMDLHMTRFPLPPLFPPGLRGGMEALQSLLCLATIDSSVALFTCISYSGSSICSCQEICVNWTAENSSPQVKSCPDLSLKVLHTHQN